MIPPRGGCLCLCLLPVSVPGRRGSSRGVPDTQESRSISIRGRKSGRNAKTDSRPQQSRPILRAVCAACWRIRPSMTCQWPYGANNGHDPVFSDRRYRTLAVTVFDWPAESPIATMMIPATRSASKTASAIVRLSAAMAASSAGSASISRIAVARACGSRTGTSRPLTPSRTVSRHPRASVVTMARPIDMASSVECGVPSCQLGRAYRLERLIAARTRS